MGTNFLSTRYDKSIDITSEGLNSLSLQSVEILKNLKEDVNFSVYYQGDIHKNTNIALKLLFKKYKRVSDKVKVQFIDAHKDPSSVEFLNQGDKGKAVVVLKRGARFERVKEPIDEDSVTSALYRLESQMNKVIYFSTGHGEKSITSSEQGMGLDLLKEMLEDKGFKVKPFNFLESTSVPEDAAMLAVVGPRKSFLDHEIKMIEDYIEENSGHVFFALDPSSEADFNPLLNELGVNVERNFVLTTQPIAGGDALAIAAQSFDESSEITSKLEEGSIVLFYEATEVNKIEDTVQRVTPLVESLPTMIPVKNLKTYQEEIQGKSVKSSNLAVLSEGLLSHDGHDHKDEDKGETPFKVIVFGDSDFLSDAYLNTVYNKDIALNSFAYLTGEENLISIQPKVAEDTKLILTSAYSAFIIIFPIVIPLLSLIVSSVLWFRRRSA
jgi:ABC-type uncharacterized transport system involved in gliding motility auxiliary subunit